MVPNHNTPSVGLNAATGGTLMGWSHVVQSLQDIFTTRFGARVMREWYGSFVPTLLGRQNDLFIRVLARFSLSL